MKFFHTFFSMAANGKLKFYSQTYEKNDYRVSDVIPTHTCFIEIVVYIDIMSRKNMWSGCHI